MSFLVQPILQCTAALPNDIIADCCLFPDRHRCKLVFVVCFWGLYTGMMVPRCLLCGRAAIQPTAQLSALDSWGRARSLTYHSLAEPNLNPPKTCTTAVCTTLQHPYVRYFAATAVGVDLLICCCPTESLPIVHDSTSRSRCVYMVYGLNISTGR